MEDNKENLEISKKLGTAVPSFRRELGNRIGQVVNLYRKKKEAAKAAGRSLEMLNFYIAGTSEIPFEVLLGLAAGVGVSIDWLATGEGEMRTQSENPALHARHVAEERPDYRAATPGQSLSEARLTLERVEAAIGYTPTIVWRETLKTLMYTHGLDEAGVERIVDLLKQENAKKG